MSLPSLILAAAMATAPVPTDQPVLSFADAEKLRCAATFALAARLQADSNPRVSGFPPLAARGEEYFIRAAAQVVDSTGLSREAVTARLQTLATALAAPGQLEAAMPSCLASLEASGL